MATATWMCCLAHGITTCANGAKAVYTADPDGDGDMDVLSASYYDDKIAWYENDGLQGFTISVITTCANGAKAVYTADSDGDGDMEVLSGTCDHDMCKWCPARVYSGPRWRRRHGCVVCFLL